MGRTLVVVGGGIAGLAGAYEARRAAAAAGVPLQVVLLEADDRLGGKIRTETIDGRLHEWGPDAVVAAKPEARVLACELGFEDELVGPGADRRTYLWLRGRLRELPPGLAMGVPTGFVPLLKAVRNGIVGPVAALRAAIEPLLPGVATDGDPSVGEVARRRLGRTVASRLVDPLVGGVYGAPADQVSLRVALPQLTGKRSLLLAVASGPRASGPVFLTPRDGMGRFVDELAKALTGSDVRTSSPALAIAPDGARWRVATSVDDITADAVLVAAPAPAAAGLLAEAAPECAASLRAMRYRTSVIVHLRYPADAMRPPPDAWGLLRAGDDRGVVAAATFVGVKWPHVSDGWLRIRCVVNAPEAVALGDDVLQDLVAQELRTILNLREPADAVHLVRWPSSMPVYEPGHLARVAAARSSTPRGIALAGAAYEGVGVPDCIRTGRRAAAALVDAMTEEAS